MNVLSPLIFSQNHVSALVITKKHTAESNDTQVHTCHCLVPLQLSPTQWLPIEYLDTMQAYIR